MTSYAVLAKLLKALPLSDDTNGLIICYLQSPTAEIISNINSKYNPDLRWISRTSKCLPTSKCQFNNRYYGHKSITCENCAIVGSYYDIEDYIWGVDEFVCRNTFLDLLQEEYRNNGVSEIKFGHWHRRYLRIYCNI